MSCSQLSPKASPALTALAFIGVLSGCTAMVVNRGLSNEQTALERAQREYQPQPRPVITELGTQPFLAGEEVKLKQGLPSVFDDTVTFVSQQPLDLTALAEKLSAMTGLRALVDISVYQAFRSGGGTGGVGTGGASVPIGGPQGGGFLGGLPPPTALMSAIGASTTGVGSLPVKMTFNWHGPLRNLLDMATARLQCSWRYDSDHDQIVFFETETKTFELTFLAGQQQVQSSVTNSGALGGSGAGGSPAGGGGLPGSGGAAPSLSAGGTAGAATAGGGVATGEAGSAGTSAANGSSTGAASASSSITVSALNSIDPYSEIRSAIDNILHGGSSAGGTGAGNAGGSAGGGASGGAMANPLTSVYVSPSTSTVTVTATPSQLEDISSYIDSINRKLEQQVIIEVRVYSVQLSDEDNYGFDLQGAFASAGLFGGAVTGVAPLTAISGVAAGQLTASIASGMFANSKYIFQALSTQGRVTEVTHGQVLALNDEPVPLQVANEQTYLAEAFTTATFGATSSGLVPGTVTVGFTANFLPLILDNDGVLLRYAMNLSQLVSLTTIQSGGQEIQAPNIAMQNFQQQAKLKSGDTLLLSGFEQVNNTRNGQGTFSPFNWLFGGGTDWQRTRNTLVITIHLQVV